MKGCIRIYVISFLLISQIHAAADKTLFDEQDDVIVFKENNYQQGLYDGVKAHTFLIYSSWCGHCQRFAPTYKKVAEAIKSWSNVVLVTGVDCVFDVAVCRHYNVRGYPTIRFIGPTTNKTDIGVTYDGDRSKESIIDFIVKMLAAVENPPKAWPNLHPVSEAEAVKYKSSTAVKKPKIILFVNKERVGQEVILDMGDPTLRFAMANSTASEILGAKTAGIGVLSADGQVSHISYDDPDATKLQQSVKSILGNDSYSKGNSDGSGESSGEQQGNIEFVDTSLQYKVYELDMQSAINTALYMEAGLKTVFTDKELQDLKNFVSVVRRCGSWTLDYKKQLSRVKDGLDKVSSLTNSGWSTILEHAADAGFPKNSTFLGCKGSKPTTRGYTCGMWILFHTMLTSCYKTQPGSVAVLNAIHGYVDSFFTCSYCRQHFLSMAERMKLLSITDDQTAILAFWEAHNQVNHRLSTEIHDPYFPKIQFPPRALCGKCSDDAGQFNTDHVFGFLMKHYRRVLTPFGRTRVTAKRKNKKSKRGKKGKKQG